MISDQRGKNGYAKVEGSMYKGKKHEENKEEAHSHACVRTRMRAYAQVEIRRSVRTHTSVHLHRYQRMPPLKSHVLRGFVGL